MNTPCLSRWLAIGLAVAAVSPVLRASKEHPVIGFSMDAFSDERWQRDRDAFVTAVQELGGRVIVQSANSDDAAQASQIDDMIKRHVDVLVVVPHNAAGMGAPMNAAKSAGIPVISYDRLITNAEVSYYLSFDNVKVGEMQAAYLVAHLPPATPAKIIRVYGAKTDNNAKLFKQGQDKVLEPLLKAGKIEVVAEGWADDWKPAIAQQIVTDALAAGKTHLDGILCSNDGLAGGAVEALTAKGIATDRIVITGQDADLAACARIKTGTQAMTVYKPVHKLARLAAKTAVDIARGNPPAPAATIQNGAGDVPAIYEEALAVDRQNITTTVLADGFHKTR